METEPSTSTVGRTLFAAGEADTPHQSLSTLTAPAEFITMMTGQPYKSPEQPAAATAGETKSDEGTPNPFQAIRGVSALSAKLKQQRVANQVFKDAWLAIEPTLKGSITPSELLWKVAPAVPGLVIGEEDIAELVDPDDAARGVTCAFPVSTFVHIA